MDSAAPSTGRKTKRKTAPWYQMMLGTEPRTLLNQLQGVFGLSPEGQAPGYTSGVRSAAVFCSSSSTVCPATPERHRPLRAKVAELADAPDLGSGGREAVGVQIPPFAPIRSIEASENEDRVHRHQ